MVSFINMFLSYFLLFLISIGIIVCAVILGKMLRDVRYAKVKAEETGKGSGE